MEVNSLWTDCVVSGVPFARVNTKECVGASSARQRPNHASSCRRADVSHGVFCRVLHIQEADCLSHETK